MRDTDLYRQILGIEKPWTVARVELKATEQRVDVFIEHATGERWACPECRKLLAVYDHTAERSWRHLDSCQFMTYLHARPPRVRCEEHGVKQVQLPWALPNGRFTALFERFAIDVLRETDITGAARILRLSWDEAWGIVERAVERGLLARKPQVVPFIGVDEKAAAKGHRYLTLVCNLEKGTVEYVADNRRRESLEGYFNSLTTEQRNGIEAIAMDMWEPFVQAVDACVPNPMRKVVFDRFHVMQHMGRAVDEVRKTEHRALAAEGRADTLKRSKYLWLYSAENLPERHRERFDALRRLNLKTGRAWALKESLRGLWSCGDFWQGWTHWKRWFFWATHSRLEPVIRAARTVERHLRNVLTYFDHRITNAVSEGINSKIQTIKKMAFGFRNKEHFKAAIYFHCGGLSLYPATHTDPG